MKKSLLLLLVTTSVSLFANATSVQFCGMGGYAVFNSENVYECTMTLNTCETAEYLNNGWLPSANGKCPTKLSPNTICGFGGAVMQHPENPELTVSSLSTCETRALSEMGWINQPSDVK